MKTNIKLLNSKSILDCDEIDTEKHNNEIIEFIEKIGEIENYECALICKYQDIANRNRKQIIKHCDLHDVINEIECFDFKNGFDVCIDDDGYIILRLFGQGYDFNDIYYLVETAVKVLPFNENRDFLDISPFFIENKKEVRISRNQF